MSKKASESFRVSKTDLEASRDRQSWASEGLSCLIRHDPVQLREGSVPPGLMSGPLGRKRLVRPESGLTKSEEEQMEEQKAALVHGGQLNPPFGFTPSGLDDSGKGAMGDRLRLLNGRPVGKGTNHAGQEKDDQQHFRYMMDRTMIRGMLLPIIPPLQANASTMQRTYSLVRFSQSLKRA